MHGLVKLLLGVSVLAFLVGVVGNVLQIVGMSNDLLWPPLTWWRGAIYCVALAMTLILKQGQETAG